MDDEANIEVKVSTSELYAFADYWLDRHFSICDNDSWAVLNRENTLIRGIDLKR